MMRILERCIKESRAIDTESLCIIAGEKASYPLHAEAGLVKVVCLQVWEIRLDLHVVDHCGNIVDCASIAAITALKYFR